MLNLNLNSSLIEFYKHGIYKFVERWNEVIESNEEYVNE